MGEENKNKSYTGLIFSKDNSIVEISSKQTQVKNSNVIPPSMPKDSNKK